MMPFADLVSLARKIARPENDARAARWLRAVATLLADWGGPQAAALLKESLPAECFSGTGAKGRSWAEAEAKAGGEARVALIEEAEHRSHEPDPRNVAMMCLPLIGIVKEQVAAAKGPAAADALVAAMPAAVRDEVAKASTRAPYSVREIAQSYARPAR